MHEDLLNWIKACPCPDWIPDEGTPTGILLAIPTDAGAVDIHGARISGHEMRLICSQLLGHIANNDYRRDPTIRDAMLYLAKTLVSDLSFDVTQSIVVVKHGN